MPASNKMPSLAVNEDRDLHWRSCAGGRHCAGTVAGVDLLTQGDTKTTTADNRHFDRSLFI